MTQANFHLPALMHGYELVADLKSTQLNIQETYEDIIMVGGHWYLARRPEDLIYAERDFNDVLKATTWDKKTHHAKRTENLRKRHDAALIAKARIVSREGVPPHPQGRPKQARVPALLLPRKSGEEVRRQHHRQGHARTA
jgi:hypothetical protein